MVYRLEGPSVPVLRSLGEGGCSANALVENARDGAPTYAPSFSVEKMPLASAPAGCFFPMFKIIDRHAVGQCAGGFIAEHNVP